MQIKSKTTLKYTDEKNAKLVYDSLEVDNENYLDSKINDKEIEYEINPQSLGSFLATIDDLIASEIVVEKIINNTSE